MANAIEFIKSILGQYFRDNFYEDGIANLREAILKGTISEEKWKEVVRLVLYRKLPKGIPLKLLHNTANLPLDENTDEEAYLWLTLMFINSSGASNELFVEY